MNSQKFGIFCLILIASVYIYFALFSNGKFEINNNNLPDVPEEFIVDDNVENNEPEKTEKQQSGIKTIKIFITDSKGNLRSVNRKCDTAKEKSCFSFAINELIKGPTEWEKSKGLSSEIPTDTKVLSIREGANNILIDLSSNFEAGGGAESTYIRVQQLIKTSQSNTKAPVYLYLNGKQANVIGGEGMMIKQPLNERSLDD